MKARRAAAAAGRSAGLPRLVIAQTQHAPAPVKQARSMVRFRETTRRPQSAIRNLALAHPLRQSNGQGRIERSLRGK
jgi:hypothetical protein